MDETKNEIQTKQIKIVYIIRSQEKNLNQNRDLNLGQFEHVMWIVQKTIPKKMLPHKNGEKTTKRKAQNEMDKP